MHALPSARSARRFLLTLLGLGAFLPTAAHADPPVVVSYGPTSGPVGSTLVIAGTGFTAPLKVRFGGAGGADTFTDTEIRVVVPDGAQTGPVTVTTAEGTAHTGVFTVVPGGSGVSLKAITPTAVAPGGGSAVRPGVATVSLGSTAATDVIVNYRVGGSAVNGQDYKLLKGSVRIAAGTTSHNIKVVPLGRPDGAVQRTVKLTLLPGSGYKLDNRGPVIITIVATPP